MLAAVLDGPGEPRLVELPAPRPGQGQVLLQVCAVEVGGEAAGVPDGVPGGGLAGVVVQLGPGSFGLEVGDHVLGHAPAGAWAQFAAVDGARLTPRPEGLPWAQAAALAGAGQAVLPALTALRLRSGERLLVLGAGRGAGPLAVQLARARGAVVLAAAGPRDHAHLRLLGARPVRPDRVAAAGSDGVDAVLVVAGDPASVGDPAPGRTVRLGGAAAAAMVAGRSAPHLLPLVELWEEGAVRPDVAAVLPLERAGRARRLAAGGRMRGAVVLRPWPVVGGRL
ncbi:zinc-binding dehydrogenase [Kitasatospora cinereorecta]|uniref:zinc-binding dehydrogenase n=1 Tax=Kitasatospora cinereorecta TaxID=285560 RepID=UPI0031F73FFC